MSTVPARPRAVPARPTTPPRARPRPRPGPRSGGGGLFRAFWRWHFFAALIVTPILLVLATTGLIYLFRFQIEPLLHPDLMRVEVPANAVAQSHVQQLVVLERAYPGAEVVSLTEAADAESPTVVSVVTAAGEARDVYLDPYGPEVLGSLNPDTTLSGYAVRLHADLMSGVVGDRIIEVAACWAVVMALTGYYLVVRGRRARRRARQRAGRRGRGARLRSRHALIGTVVGVGLLGLLVTGLPWTGFWGEQVQRLATERGSSLWSTDPGAISNPTSTLDESLPHSHDVPWAAGKQPVPRSGGGGADDAHSGSSATVDTALVVAERAGLRHPMTVAMPADDDPGGVFSVIGYAFDAPSDERTVHVDRYGGQVVSAYGFEDYPALAKVVAHGIGVHEGRSLGLWSFWGSAAMCLGVIALCVTGPLMWWRRRPRGAGRLGAPRGRLPVRSTPWLALALLVLGLLLPLFGLSLLVVLTLDEFVLRRVPALAAWFDSA